MEAAATKSFTITLLINIVVLFGCVFFGRGDMCNPGIGIAFGALVFIPATVILTIVSLIITIRKSNKTFKGILVAEAATILLLAVFLIIAILQ